MKIGILTFQNTLNYGAVLQCYALWSVIKEFGYDVEVINYRNARIETNEGLIGKTDIKNRIKCFIRNKRGKIRKFELFKKAFFSLSQNYDFTNVTKIANAYDCIIVGSDQVWAPGVIQDDDVYLLPFITDSRKKKTYAASFGIEKMDQKYESLYKGKIDSFSSLLIREHSGVDIIEKLIQNDSAVQVIDPTLLVDRKKWVMLAEKSDIKPNKEYVLVYAISEHEKALGIAKQIAEEKKLCVIDIMAFFYDWRRKKGVDQIWDASPIDFVKMFMKAKYSVVSSFHGVCFSIIAKIPFIYVPDNYTESRATRIMDLFRCLGIQNRTIDDYNKHILKDIDYELVYTNLMKIREASASLLFSSLERDKNVVPPDLRSSETSEI